MAPPWLEHCRSFIDAVGDQMIVVGEDYRILLANRAFLDQFGTAEDAIVGRHCYEVTHRSPRPCAENGDACPLNDVLSTGEVTKVTHEHCASDGHRCVVDIVGSPVRDPDGNIVGLLEAMRDVTEQKELEEALLERNAELERARRDRQQFTSTVCHELRNVANAMSLQAQVLKRSTDPAKTRERAEIIISESKQLGRLVEDMRDASAIESQRFSLRPSSCDITEVVRRRAETYRLATAEHELEVRTPDEPVVGLWDGQRLGQVVDNLLSNAIKFSPNGGEVRVEVDHDGDEVTISVSDRGLGMSPEQLAQIFEPYARAHEDIGGVGLGLFVARGIVEAHGGTITVTSTVDVGTVFSLRLPVADETA